MKVKSIVGFLALAVSFSSPAAVIFNSLLSFDSSTGGYFPHCALVQGADGSFYGTTLLGGPNFEGSVFKMSPDGQLKTLVWFDGTNGAEPAARLLQGTDGYLYGTTQGGGTNAGSLGTIFKMSTNGDLVTLFTFAGTNGMHPNGLTRGSDGNFYGTTMWGGTDTNSTLGLGTVFGMNPVGTLVTLAYFDGTNGSLPQGELTQGTDGHFYGTTETGGDHDLGTVFRITTNGVLSTLISFDGTNGAYPMCGLTESSNGCFYGVTQNGGTNFMGTVFKTAPGGAFTLLHTFSSPNNGENSDGAQPLSNLVQGDDGCFYGTASSGGANGFGTIFKMTPDGEVTTLYSFGSTTNFYGHPLDGLNPNALVRGADGNFYGTTYNGGTNNNVANNGDGTVFRLSVPMPPVFEKITQTNGVWSLTWSAVAGQVYQLQFTASLDSSNWMDLGDTNVATDGIMSATDNTGSVAQRFYRIVLP